MNVTKMAGQVGVIVLGVFVAGLIMNAFRSNDFVRQAIDGFDS
jgi:hypothetical protein